MSTLEWFSAIISIGITALLGWLVWTSVPLGMVVAGGLVFFLVFNHILETLLRSKPVATVLVLLVFVAGMGIWGVVGVFFPAHQGHRNTVVIPPGATLCNDGTITHSTGRGRCSHHGGVAY